MLGRICVRDIWDLMDKGLVFIGKDNGCIGYYVFWSRRVIVILSL